MLTLLNPRLLMVLAAAIPMAGGAVLHPQGVTAFALGAWGGFIFVGLPLMLAAWLIGLRSLAETLRPIARLPILIGLTIGLMFVSGVDLPATVQALGAGATLWWLKFRARLF